MTSQIFGFHISPHGTSEVRIREIVRRSGARTHTVLHSAGLAKAVYDEAKAGGVDDPIIILRADWPDQDWTRAPFNDPDRFVADRAHLVRGWGLLQYLNEPVVTNTAQLQDLLNKCMQFMDACVKYGIRGSVGGFADASMFQQNWLEAGLFDAFLRKAVEWTHAGHGVINHHDYSYGAPMKNGGGHSERDMLDPAKMDDSNWSSADDMQKPAPGGFLAQAETGIDEQIAYHAALFLLSERGQRPEYNYGHELFRQTHGITPTEFLATHFAAQYADHNWTAMRYMWPLLRAQKLTGQGYWIVVGEYGPQDDMPHLRVAGISNEIERKFVGGRKLRGPLQQADLYIHWWPKRSKEASHAAILRWQAKVVPKWVLGYTLFALNEDPEWASFNYFRWPEFWSVFYALCDELRSAAVVVLPPVAKPTSAGIGVPARLLAPYNLRTGPSKAYPPVRVIPAGEIVVYYPNQPNKPKNEFTWVFVEVGDEHGWMALENQFARLVPDGWPADNGALLGVPFISQRGTGEKNNCGEAAVTSGFNFIGSLNGNEALETLPVEKVVEELGNNGDFSSLDDLHDVAAMFGVKTTVAAFQTLDKLRSELDAGRPFVALVERGKLPGALQFDPFGGAHFTTVIGYDAHKITLLDPLMPADTDGRLRIYVNEFAEAWKRTTGNDAQYQALFFDSSNFEPEQPPEEEQPPEQPPTTPPIIPLPPLPEIIAGSSEKRKEFAEFLRWLGDVVEHYPAVDVTPR